MMTPASLGVKGAEGARAVTGRSADEGAGARAGTGRCMCAGADGWVGVGARVVSGVADTPD